jgi:NAD(P)-dependent dehydrogenase (short-subunit alcohol dehydrogenase family)
MRLDGKTIIVTGAGSGIGRAACAVFAAEGARIVGVDVDAAGLDATAAATAMAPVVGSVADLATWDAAIAAAERAGGLDGAYLNAGRYGFRGPIAEHPLDDYHSVLETNVTGVVYGVRACVPALKARGGGAISVTASVAGIVPFAGNPIYTLTKHAVAAYVRAVAPSLSGEGVRINAVCPGIVDTPMTAALLGDRPPTAEITMITPERIAHTALDLLVSGDTGICRIVREAGEPVDWTFPTFADIARA